jgi:hypothetical protein
MRAPFPWRGQRLHASLDRSVGSMRRIVPPDRFFQRPAVAAIQHDQLNVERFDFTCWRTTLKPRIEPRTEWNLNSAVISLP